MEKKIPDNLQIMDYEDALDTMSDDKDLLLSLLPQFIEISINTVHKLENLKIHESTAEIGRELAHSIKGSARNISIERLGFAAELVEHAFRDKQFDVAKENISLIAKELDGFIEFANTL